MGGQHCRGFSQRLGPRVDHGRAVHLGPVSVSLRIGLDMRQGVMGEGVSDVAHHGGLGDGHTLRVESREVGWQWTSQVSHRVNGDVSDGLGGYLLVSGGGGRSRRDRLRGGGGGARRRGDMRELLVIGWQAVIHGLNDGRVGDGSVSDDGWLDLHGRGLNGMSRQLGGGTRGWSRGDGLRGRRTGGGRCS